MEAEVVQQSGTEIEAERGPGRPPIITMPVVEKIAKLIAKGMTEEQACTPVGVNHSSFRTARHRNEEFETAVKRAQAEFLDSSLDTIGKGSKGWQSLAWILERRHGDQFRRNTAVELNGQLGAFSAADLLAKKPLAAWTKADVDLSLGAWCLIRRFSTEELEQLRTIYERAWGPLNNWTDEQLEWAIAIGQRIEFLEHADRSSEQANALAGPSPVVEITAG